MKLRRRTIPFEQFLRHDRVRGNNVQLLGKHWNAVKVKTDSNVVDVRLLNDAIDMVDRVVDAAALNQILSLRLLLRNLVLVSRGRWKTQSGRRLFLRVQPPTSFQTPLQLLRNLCCTTR